MNWRGLPDREKIESHIQVLESYLVSTFHGTRQLANDELQRLTRRQPIRGWRLPTRGSVPELDVFLTAGFPYSLPRVALSVAQPNFPHSESDGTLCLENERATFEHYSPEAVLQDQLQRAFELLEGIGRGEHDSDFLDDFERYWAQYASNAPDDLAVVTLLKGRVTTRKAIVAACHDKIVISDDPDELDAWLANCYSTPKIHAKKVQAIIAPINAILRPSEYPSSGRDVLDLLGRVNDDAALLLRQVGKGYPELAIVLLVFPRAQRPEAQGAIVLARTTLRAKQKKDARRARGEQLSEDGSLWVSNADMTRLAIRRGDVAWVHGRYLDANLPILQDRRVCVIGVGALGSGIALSLAQAGVTDLILVDPDRLDTANLSRHVLAAEDVNHYKAARTLGHIKQVLPHSFESAAWTSTWQSLWDKEPDALRNADLIICVTGNWNSDVELSDLQKSGETLPPVIYGWVEPHAAASHAVLLGNTGACLRCHFRDSGESDVQVTEWPRQDIDVQTCGALHSPFGAAAMSFAASMIATMAIEILIGSTKCGEWRVWTAGESNIQRRGGVVNPQWVNRFGEIGSEPRIQTIAWMQSELCRACRDG